MRHEIYINGKLINVEEIPDSLNSQEEALAVIQAVRDPKQTDPSVIDRLSALEALIVPE